MRFRQACRSRTDNRGYVRAAAGKNHLMWRPVHELLLSLIVDQADCSSLIYGRPAKCFRGDPANTSWRVFSGIEVRIVHHADERPFRLRGRTDAPIGFLVDIEPDDALNQREVLRNIGMISSIHFALSPPAWRTTFLQSGSAFFRCKERIDFLEHPLEALPAAVLCATVVPIHPGPIDVRMPRVIVHRGPIASIVIGDIRAPNPDYVGCAGGNEEIVNVSIRET